MPQEGGAVQRRTPVSIAGVDVGVILDEQRDDSGIAAHRRPSQRSHSECWIEGIDVGAVVELSTNGVDVSRPHGRDQTGCLFGT